MGHREKQCFVLPCPKRKQLPLQDQRGEARDQAATRIKNYHIKPLTVSYKPLMVCTGTHYFCLKDNHFHSVGDPRSLEDRKRKLTPPVISFNKGEAIKE